MSAKVGYSTPMLHAAEIERSIRFYELLGFVTVDTDRSNPLGWARLHCDGGAVMFLRAEEPLDPVRVTTMLYMYTADLALCASNCSPPESKFHQSNTRPICRAVKSRCPILMVTPS